MVKKITPFQAFLFHVLLGVVAKYLPIVLTAYYLAFIVYAGLRIHQSQDSGHCAGRYVLYVMGMEIVYRIGGATIIYELGKYACITLLLLGIASRSSRSDIRPFFIYLLLLLPAVALTSSEGDFKEYINTILFSLGGPITLALSGMYFFKRKIWINDLWQLARMAVLPGVSLVTVLFLGPAVGAVELMAESNFELSGGFGPNQVSTALGYFALLLVFANWNREVLTFNKWIDYLLIALFLFRGLLTFSRGGTFAFVFTILGTTVAMMILSGRFRRHIVKYALYLVFLVSLGGGLFFMANKATDNWLLYRYQGVSTFQVATGTEKVNHSYLSGREDIAEAEFELFMDNWFTGVGAGMSSVVRASLFEGHLAMASHSEFSRMLAEHGLFGMLSLLLLLVIYPIRRIGLRQTMLSKQFFFFFYILGLMTMLHASMRLALPGVIAGFAFATIVVGQRPNLR